MNSLVLKDCDLPHSNHGHVILAKPSPALLYQIGTHDTRFLVDIPNPLPKSSTGELQSYLLDSVGPQLPASVRPSFERALQEDRIRSMPCCWLPATKNQSVGAIALGDAQNMRHPLTGGGMTVAFWDVVYLTELLKDIPDLNDRDLVHKKLQQLHWKRKSLSSVINILANALYELFSAGSGIYKPLFHI